MNSDMSTRLLYLAPAAGLTLDQSGGAGTHMRGTIKGFEENGLEVMAVIGGDVLRKPGAKTASIPAKDKSNRKSVRELFKSLMPDRLRLLARDMRTVLEDYRIQRKIIQQVVSFGPSAIYERSAYLSSMGNRISKKLNIPHLLETDGCMVEIIHQDYGVFSKRLGNWLEQRKLKNANWAVVMNRSAIHIVSEKFQLPKEKFVVKRLGISAAAFPYDNITIDDLKQQYELHNKLVIGFVGAISTYHGVQFLIDAALNLHNQNCRDIVIVIVGWSKEAEQLKQKAEFHGLTNLIFTGKVDKSEVANYYKLFHVGVIPDAEPGIYPIKVLEYGLFGLCPLVPDYEIFHEVVEAGKNGYYFKPRDAKDLGDAMVRIEANRQSIQEYAANWSATVQQNFQWKDTVRDVIKVIDNNANSTSA